MDKKNLDFNEFDSVSKAEWKEKVITDLRGKAFEEIMWKDENGNLIQPFYASEDIPQTETSFSIVERQDAFQIGSAFAGHDPKVLNENIKTALMNGCNSIFVDCPITGAENLRLLLKDIQLDAVSINFKDSHYSNDIALWMIELSKELGVSPQEINGCIEFKDLSNSIADGRVEDAWKGKVSELAHIAKFNFTDFRVIDIDVSSIHNSGGNTVLELATALSMGHEYLVHLLEQGFKLEVAASMMQFTFSTGTSYFNEIAKYRAIRSLWEQVLEQYAENSDSLPEAFVHAETSYWNLATMDIHNNLLRATTAASSAILGGVNSLTVLPYNAALEENHEEGERLARNIQLVLLEEAYLAKVVDPGKGSYYLEKIGHTLAESSWQMFQKMEEQGGFCKVVENGFIQDKISLAKQAQEEAFDTGNKVVLGVNKYPNPKEKLNLKRKKSSEMSKQRLSENKELDFMKNNISL